MMNAHIKGDFFSTNVDFTPGFYTDFICLLVCFLNKNLLVNLSKNLSYAVQQKNKRHYISSLLTIA